MDETIEHLFALCPITRRILEALREWEPLQVQNVQFDIQGLLIWDVRDTVLEETFCNTVNILTKQYIWSCRKGPILPKIR